MTNNCISLDLIKIIQFYLKIYDLYRHHHPHPMGCGCLGGSMGGVRSND